MAKLFFLAELCKNIILKSRSMLKIGKEDTSYSIDFNLMAQHLLELNTQAKKNGLKIEKVILKIALKDDLFASEYRKKLKASGIYFAANLSELIDSLHDDHYHVDFGILK
ncbi:hypothetical protein [Fluviicola taffensis]|uniref:hypothetical protein n=1 Tax=Fluviicola taffensis TaxID=191579 RepID=UPI0005B62483|nr:hypothetical protein [Fluviicola taffensis]